jgi:hypothetical protein
MCAPAVLLPAGKTKVLFMSLAYIATSVDHTGLFAWLALRITQVTGLLCLVGSARCPWCFAAPGALRPCELSLRRG